MADPTYIFCQSELPKLDYSIDRGIDFIAWYMQWGSYCFLLELDNQDMVKQVKALMLCLSRETLVIVHKLQLSEAQMKKLSTIIEAM